MRAFFSFELVFFLMFFFSFSSFLFVRQAIWVTRPARDHVSYLFCSDSIDRCTGQKTHSRSGYTMGLVMNGGCVSFTCASVKQHMGLMVLGGACLCESSKSLSHEHPSQVSKLLLQTIAFYEALAIPASARE